MKILIILIICAFYSNNLLAQPGTIDSSFNGTGQLIINIDSSQVELAQAVVVQPDNKIIIGGTTGFNMVLLRLNNDGSLDSSFSTDGIAITDFSGIDRASAVALQKDGKIIIAGNSSGGNYEVFAIARYNSNGTLDSTYGVNGKVDFGNSEQLTTIDIQPDGKILAGGLTVGSGPFSFLLVKI